MEMNSWLGLVRVVVELFLSSEPCPAITVCSSDSVQ